MAYLEVFIDGFAYFSLFPYIIYGHLKCVSRLRATLYIIANSDITENMILVLDICTYFLRIISPTKHSVTLI